jgi:hypothetical protein
MRMMTSTEIGLLCVKFVSNYTEGGVIDISLAKEIITALPNLYRNDYLFRIRFEDSFRYGLVNTSNRDEQFKPLRDFALILSNTMVKRPWVFSQLFVFHVITDLRGCSLLEIGGCLPECLLNLFSISAYTGTGLDHCVSERESATPSLSSTTKKHFVVCDIQAETCLQLLPQADRIFSTACLEHIHDLPIALENCFNLTASAGYFYAYIAPIYSHLRDGQHGYIDKQSIPNLDDAAGLHLIPVEDQFRRLNRMGFTDGKSREILAGLYFNRDISHKYFEEYYIALTGCSYYPVKIETMEDYSVIRRFLKEFKVVRRLNPRAINVSALAITCLLYKQ